MGVYLFKQQISSHFYRLILLFLCVINTAFSQDISGRVIGVADGDTLFIIEEKTHNKMTIRLNDIDAPEREQAYGQRSRQSLISLCYRRPVLIKAVGRDQYDRVLGRVFCDGIDANAQQVKLGMAWVYSRYLDDPSLYKLQDEAKEAQRGLWHDFQPEEPWRFRRNTIDIPSIFEWLKKIFRSYF